MKKGSYHDSVVLMLLTNQISTIEGVKKVSIMMATPANKDIYRQSGLATEELEAASANDLVIVADIDDDSLLDTIEAEMEEFFKKQSTESAEKKGAESVKSWEKALTKQPDANLAVISIPGAYAALEADRALDEGLNVFMFSDNVTLEDEVKLKNKAHEKGLAVMGPDCGTGIIQSVPIAFTNNVAPGSIGIIGASGTGIQELTTIIDRLGEGVTNAIGIGGRDLNAAVGGITMMDMIDAMEDDDAVKVLVIVSKPPAKEVRDKIAARLSNFSKPIVTLFVGEKPEYHEENFYHAYTLDEAARLAVGLVRGEEIPEASVEVDESSFYKAEDKKTIKAYYSGGTLANEAAMLIKDAMDVKVPPEDIEGYMLQLDGNVVVDLGDDAYTQGKPHPMIDPAKRIECMQEAVDDESTGAVLFDIMLGYGSHADMAGALLPTIKELMAKAEGQGRKVFFVATVCGTRRDFQGYDDAVNKLKEAGVIVCENNKLACRTAIRAIGRDFNEPAKEIRPKQVVDFPKAAPSEKLRQLLSEKPKIINIGLKSFAEVVEQFGCEVVQYDWMPPGRLKEYEEWMRREGMRKRKREPKGLSLNTISTYMRNLKAVYHRMVGEKVLPYNPKLFDDVYTKVESQTKRALELEQMNTLLCTDLRKLPSDLRCVLAYFLLMFLFRGMPFIDLAYLRKQDVKGNRIVYSRHKTGRQMTVRIPKEAMELMKEFKSKNPDSIYLFPILHRQESKKKRAGKVKKDKELYMDYLRALRGFNLKLEKIASLLLPGVKLSSYVAKHHTISI